VTGRLDDEAALALLVGALERMSPSGQEGEVARYLADAMTALDAQAGVDAAGNAVATVGRGPMRVVLLGHIDTVRGELPVRRAGGVVTGRGAVDAKGPFCTMVAAASRLSPAALTGLTLHLVGAVEEEAPTSKGARHAVRTLPRPDAVVIGEPSGWDGLTLGYKGRLVLQVETRRPEGHSARDEATAAEAAVDAFVGVRRWATGRSTPSAALFDAVQVSLRALDSGSDGLVSRASATLSLRLPPDLPPDQAEAELRALLADVPEGVERAITVTGAERAYRGPRDTLLTRAFRTAIRRHGGTPRLTLKTGTSDMNVVAPSWPVPMAAYGPGDAALDHTPHERVAEDEYLRAIAVLADALEGVAQAASGGGARGRSARSSS
jgi:[amino group carrier protein]-lysine/ornithine hydrolase